MKVTEKGITWQEAADINSRIWRQDGGRMTADGRAESNHFKVTKAKNNGDGTWDLTYEAK